MTARQKAVCNYPTQLSGVGIKEVLSSHGIHEYFVNTLAGLYIPSVGFIFLVIKEDFK